MIGLYVHVPYCRTVCPYCDFVKRPLWGDVPREFLDALYREIDTYDGPDKLASVFFGGGTPSLLSPEILHEFLARLRERFVFSTGTDEDSRQTEITIEANPDDVTGELVDAWLGLGINRVSLGVQSFNDDVLRYLGRRHDADAARGACALVADRFKNWNMDLIFGAPPVEAWESTLEECRSMEPPHVSTYALSYEEGTPFHYRRDEAVDDDTSLGMAHAVLERLDHVERYEVSNFSKATFECRHNLVYWHNEEYVGLGPGAYTFIHGVRSRNLSRVDDYVQQPNHKMEFLSLPDREVRTETLIQHFRLRDGLSRTYYRRRFAASVEDDFAGPITALCKRGLLADDGDRLRPTEAGFDLNNEIGLALVT